MFTRDSIFPPRPRPREYETYDENDPAAFDPESGIVRHGVRLRCKMTTTDAVPPQRSNQPMIINTGLVGEHALRNFFHADGSPRRRKTRETDRFGREVATYEGEDPSPHRPGYRVSDAAAGQALKDSAYFEMCDFISNQWRGESQTASLPAATNDAARPAGVSEADWQRELMIRDTCSAWSRDSYTPAEGAPKGLYPLGAWPDTLHEGANCSTGAGEVGVWTRGSDDNYLYCRPQLAGTPKIPATNPSTTYGRDAGAVGTKQAVEDAYNEMCAELREAWRKQG